MKYTAKDLLKAMGLKVGDLVKMKWAFNSDFCYYRITEDFAFQNIQTKAKQHISAIVDNYEYEKIEQTGTYGNARCSWNGIECKNCPLRMLPCGMTNPYRKKLKDIWEQIKQSNVTSGFEEDNDINRIIKQRLDQYIIDEKLRKLIEQDEEQNQNTEQIEEGEKQV